MKSLLLTLEVPELKPIKIGMILVGPRNDKGWSQAHFEGGEYAVEKMGGSLDDDYIVVDFVNPADSPDLTVPDVVSDMIDQGAGLSLQLQMTWEMELLKLLQCIQMYQWFLLQVTLH